MMHYPFRFSKVSMSSSSNEMRLGFMNMSHDIFLSYCRADREIMEDILHCLKNSGLNVFSDSDIEIGDPNWRQILREAIKTTRCLIVVLTPCVPNSRWVMEELATAETFQKSVYPVLAVGDEKSSVPFGYMTSNWIDIRNEQLCGNAMIKLADAIKFRYGLSLVVEENFQPWLKMIGKWKLSYSGSGFTGSGIYEFDDKNNFTATIFNPIFSENEEQVGWWKITGHQLIIEGKTKMRGQSMQFRSGIELIKVDMENGLVRAAVITNGFRVLGELARL